MPIFTALIFQWFNNNFQLHWPCMATPPAAPTAYLYSTSTPINKYAFVHVARSSRVPLCQVRVTLRKDSEGWLIRTEPPPALINRLPDKISYPHCACCMPATFSKWTIPVPPLALTNRYPLHCLLLRSVVTTMHCLCVGGLLEATKIQWVLTANLTSIYLACTY